MDCPVRGSCPLRTEVNYEVYYVSTNKEIIAAKNVKLIEHMQIDTNKEMPNIKDTPLLTEFIDIFLRSPGTTTWLRYGTYR